MIQFMHPAFIEAEVAWRLQRNGTGAERRPDRPRRSVLRVVRRLAHQPVRHGQTQHAS